MTLPGTDHAFANEVYARLKAAGVRVELDDRNEKIGYKIREARQEVRVPHMIIIGGKEIETGTVSVRNRDTDATVSMTVDELIEMITAEIKDRVTNI